MEKYLEILKSDPVRYRENSVRLIEELIAESHIYDQSEVYYTYVYLDPTAEKGEYKYIGIDQIFEYPIFYVGKGVKYRFSVTQHTRKEGTLKNKILKIRRNNNEPIVIKLYDKISEYMAFIHEAFIIAAVGRRDLKLGTTTNLTDGGEGPSGKKGSNGRKGHKASDETKERMSVSGKALNRKITPEHKEKLKKSRQRAVHKIDPLTNDILETFESMHDAENKTGIHHGNICAVCVGTIPFAGGFKWELVDKTRPLNTMSLERRKQISEQFARKIRQIDIKTGKNIKVFDSLLVAQEETNIDARRISEVCYDQKESAGGFLWEYLDKPILNRRKHKYMRMIKDILKKPRIGVTVAKAVNKIDPNSGKIIKTYKTIDAAGLDNSIDSRKIGYILKTNSDKIVGGFIWKLSDKLILPIKLDYKKLILDILRTPVVGGNIVRYIHKIDPSDGKVIAIYSSNIKAANDNNIDSRRISQYLNTGKTYKGFKWITIYKEVLPIKPRPDYKKIIMDILKEPILGRTKPKNVNKINPDNDEIISTYSSIHKAATDNNISPRWLTEVLTDYPSKILKGFKWEIAKN
jgi:hypothetical protein